MRYVLQFYKEGYMKYISHLDMLRLFKRSFKRAGIKLRYSQGFNPHPKMSFAQPLSLGFTGSRELLEFETEKAVSPQIISTSLNAVLPEGVGILSCKEWEQGGKSLAALINEADYEITILVDRNSGFPEQSEELNNKISEYLLQDKIILKKFQKKSRKEVEVDLKPMIKSFNGCVDNNNITLTCRLSAGSQENLNPEMVLLTFYSFIDKTYEKSAVQIKRTGLSFLDSKAAGEKTEK